MIYYFGSHILDTRTATLAGPGGVVPLRRQAFRLCEVLLANAPHLMERDQLLDEVWGRTAISPNALPQAISELRHALGDNAQSPRYIETLHRRGYRVICPVQAVADETAEPGRSDSLLSGSEPIPALPTKEIAPGRVRQRRKYLGFALASGLAIVTAWTLWQWNRRDTLYLVTIPDIRATGASDIFVAWRKTREALRDFPSDPGLQQLMLDLTIPASLTSVPSGATVVAGPYDGPDSALIVLGKTPLEGLRLPLTMLKYRVTKPGFVGLELAPGFLPVNEEFRLHPEEARPEGMVFVPGGRVTYMGETRNLDSFWIQEHEVSNREYLGFVEADGYRSAEYWQHAVTVDGKTLTPEEVFRLFVDSTGLPGPSSWALGTYPPGEADYPVQGVSWFEAAAYAQFKDLEIPTVFHWWRAAGRGGPQESQFSEIITASNFQSPGAWPVGNGGLGPYGTRDMAGNVGEWCANPSGSSRHFLGGSWVSPPYAFSDSYAQPALSRGEGYGFRLIKTEKPLPELALVSIERPSLDPVRPVGDETFQIFARQYQYDAAPLDARLEDIDTTQRNWRRERVTFNAAYGEERVILNLFIPKNARPPYQVVVHFPGGDALLLDSSSDAGLLSVEPFLRTGRAVAYPVYKGTFERKGRKQRGPLAIRRQLIEQVQDVSRTLDYLETRDDVAREKIAFHGLSYGAIRAPFILAIEKRFAAAMILSAGIPSARLPPELTIEHYLPRVTQPALFLTGRDDFDYPHESAQLPFFEKLGTAADKKKHVTFEGGHLPALYSELQKEVIAWMDLTLGVP